MRTSLYPLQGHYRPLPVLFFTICSRASTCACNSALNQHGYWWRSHSDRVPRADAARAAKAERRVLARIPSSHDAPRPTWMAVAVMPCGQWLGAGPMARRRRQLHRRMAGAGVPVLPARAAYSEPTRGGRLPLPSGLQGLVRPTCRQGTQARLRPRLRALRAGPTRHASLRAKRTSHPLPCFGSAFGHPDRRG
jgi:hypothetical protein